MYKINKKYHFIYKTTNLITGRYYYGMHSTDNLNDGYLGSGHALWKSIRKYGKENFVREIIEFCNSRAELKEKEKEIVNFNEIAKKECYNMVTGGGGHGFKSPAHMLKCQRAGAIAANIIRTKKLQNKIKNDKEFIKRWTQSISNSLIEYYKQNDNTMLGKKHSDETKKKMSESRRGSLNNMYGKCWINKDGINKVIKKEELKKYLNNNWIKGRV